MRGSIQWVRFIAAGFAVGWVAAGLPVLVPFAATTVALAVVSTGAVLVYERRFGRPLALDEHPLWLVAADTLTVAAWVLGTATDPNTFSVVVFAAAGAEGAYRFGPRGAAGVFALAAVVRVAQELLRVSAGLPPSTLTRVSGEILITALLVIFFAAIVDSYLETRRRADGLQRVVESFSGTLEPSALSQRLVDGALAVVRADYGFVVERALPIFRVIAAAGGRIPPLPADPRGGMIAEVVRLRRTVAIDDYRSWPAAIPSVRDAGARVVIATPIWVEDEIAAVFVVGRYTAEPFERRERDSLEFLAAHAAVAFRTARLVAKTRQLEELSRQIALEGDERELFQRVSDAAAELLEVESAAVTWLEAGHNEGDRVTTGLARRLEQRAPSRGMLGRVERERRTVVVDDYQSWPEANPPARALGYRAAVGVPITVDAAVVAALTAATTQPERRFTASEIGLLETLAAQASIGVRNARLRREREERAEHLAVLNNAARTFSSARDLRRLYELVYRMTCSLLPTDAFYLSLYDPDRRAHTFVLRMDEGREWERDVVYPLADGPTSRVVTTGRAVLTLEAQPTDLRFGNEARPSLSAVHVPMRAGERVVGVLSAQRYVERGYREADVALLEALASHAAAAIENAQLLAHTHDLYMASVRALAAAVDARDPYTRSHSARTSALARAIAEEMELAAEDVRRVQLGALLHDIGKIGIPDAVLNKPGRFTHEERLVMMTHAALGGAILQSVEPLRELAPIVRHHHERFDGAGYPDGLGADDVPLSSFIVAAADAFEVIVSKRAYKEAQSVEFAVEELRRNAGTQFHPRVVDSFLRVIERDIAHGSSYLHRLGQAGHEELESQISGPATLVEQFAATSRAHARQLAILQRLASEITAVLDIETLADRLLRIVCESMAYENGFLLTLGDSGDFLEVRAAVGPSTNYLGQRLGRGKGISWRVLDSGRALNVGDVRDEPSFFGPSEIRSSLVVPLVLGNERVGVLGMESVRANAFDLDDEQMLTTVSHQLAAAIRVARLHQEAKTAAATDALTGLANRRIFFERLEAELARARDSGAALAVAMIDVDGLKATNDTFGHRSGDAALQRIASVIVSEVRSQDLVARLGGDEFGVLFPGLTQLSAERVMRRLEERIAGERANDPTLPTISWGTAPLGEAPTSADAVMDAADRAMYRHKTMARRRASAREA
ncbi:MAG TPA: GAF domain-containing protein [Candidatus Dormibacteraeota bacterium]|nr:GAF domain-containing protein [Candidatus Dormibacteraeota bacterium]